MPNRVSFFTHLERHGRETGNGNVYRLALVDWSGVRRMNRYRQQ